MESKTFQIVGLPGSGKTTLVAKLNYKVYDIADYSDLDWHQRNKSILSCLKEAKEEIVIVESVCGFPQLKSQGNVMVTIPLEETKRRLANYRGEVFDDLDLFYYQSMSQLTVPCDLILDGTMPIEANVEILKNYISLHL